MDFWTFCTRAFPCALTPPYLHVESYFRLILLILLTYRSNTVTLPGSWLLKMPISSTSYFRPNLRRGGSICLAPGGDAELRCRYSHSAVGKLGVVLSEGRPPRLALSVASRATLFCLIRLRTRRCMMSADACLWSLLERLCAVVLDVSKAHRRVCIRPAGQGLLCFRHRGRLDQSLTLNFSARASGFYWGRRALVRFLHRLIFSAHSALIYVDDLLALLERSSAPVWACLLTVAILVLNMPMSWQMAQGSSFDLDCFYSTP